MEAIARSKYQKGSPQKARLVIDLIRGKNVAQALAILKFTNKRAAGPIAKCLNSAIANATYKAEQQNIAIDPDDLWVKACHVDMGPTKNRRRLRPAPQGRAYFERRHYCHITIEVTSEAKEEKKDEKTYEKRGKKVLAKQAGGDQKKEKAAKKKDEKAAEAAPAAETATDEAPVRETASEEKTAATEEKKKTAKTDKAATEDKKQPAAEAEAKTDEATAEESAAGESADAGEAADEAPFKPETSEDPVGEATPENKPLAAKTDEEKTGTDEAADRQVDENEELERQ